MPQIEELLDNCTIPDAKVLYVTDRVPFVCVHDEESKFNITYLGSKPNVLRLQKEVNKERPPASSSVKPPQEKETEAEVNLDNSVTSPRKYENLHNSSEDSGNGSPGSSKNTDCGGSEDSSYEFVESTSLLDGLRERDHAITSPQKHINSWSLMDASPDGASKYKTIHSPDMFDSY